MPTDWYPPPWCAICPNREECPILNTDWSWNCAAKEIYKEKGEIK